MSTDFSFLEDNDDILENRTNYPVQELCLTQISDTYSSSQVEIFLSFIVSFSILKFITQMTALVESESFRSTTMNQLLERSFELDPLISSSTNLPQKPRVNFFPSNFHQHQYGTVVEKEDVQSDFLNSHDFERNRKRRRIPGLVYSGCFLFISQIFL